MTRRVILPADPGDVWLTDSRGIWRGAKTGEGRTATMSCPTCGGRASLSGHEIAEDGKVTPSVVCPHDGCDFHEWVTLEDWTP